uniref:Uncharacterized protein n=1 Tax=Brassica oleracea TaxID=3712 RepID=A0A3P6DX34_BRAOL|nr:unnamed protein product [Brassica oleracea]
MTRIFSRIPSPIFTKKLKGTSETGGTKQDQEVSTKKLLFLLFLEEREDLDKIDEMEEIGGMEKTKLIRMMNSTFEHTITIKQFLKIEMEIKKILI